ncbi:MAG TPA: prepilin-type N-terminal cleavage/methylation domain-containing protein [Sandaracinaceae bacterium]
MQRSRRHGFTLMELMIVVAIVGILSAIAIPSFRSYIHRSRTSEALTFLAEIKQRQEAYRAEFGQYCAVSGSNPNGGEWAPATAPVGGEKVAWTGEPGAWSELGAAPDGPVLFQYRTMAGPPGAPNGIPGYDGSDFWFVAQARGDLDGDGEAMILEAYSISNHIYRADEAMQPLGAAYE